MESALLSSLPAKVRAFIAVRVNDRVEAALARFIDEKSKLHDGIAWARPAKLHVTLKFLGTAIDSRLLAPLVDALERLTSATPSFRVVTRGVGTFPDAQHPRILWAGLESRELATLAAQIEEIAVSVGFDRSDRPWVPHLTLGRVRNPRKSKRILELVNDSRDRNFGESLVSEVTLYRSRPSPDSTIHERLALFPLRSP